MPEGRAERAVEAPAKSIDGAEPSGMIERVMAVAQIDTQDLPHVLGRGLGHTLVLITRSDLAAECRSDCCVNRTETTAQIRSQSPGHVHHSATRKPWCERPHPFRRGATPRSRRRGRSHHGLLPDNRRRGVLTGGKVRRPIAAMTTTSGCAE